MRFETVKSLAHLAACIAVAALGGAIATAIHLPLGWLIGSLIVTAALSLRQLPVKIMPYGRELSQGLVGLAAGQRLSPEVAEKLVTLLPVMFMATLATILFACFQSRILARLTGIDQHTALFSSLPGGVAEMAVLADRYGGDPGLVSVGQFLRILLVTLTVPQILGFLDHPPPQAPILSLNTLQTGPVLLLLCAAALAIGMVMMRLRVPNGWLLAGVFAGGFAGLMELPGTAVPPIVLVCAQVLIGAALGSRCKPSLLRAGRLFLPVNLAGTAMLIALAFGMAWGLDAWLGLGQASLVLALAPGGIAEMSLVATSEHLDLVIVVAFHLMRVLLIIALSVPLMRLWVKPASVSHRHEDGSTPRG